MADLNIASWNVQNLFDLQVAKRLQRGPQSKKEREAKLDRLGGVVGDFFGKRGPDLFAVAEVVSRALFDELIDRIHRPYSHTLRVWEGATMPQHRGLGLVGRDERIAGLKVLDVWRPTAAARPRVMLVEGEPNDKPFNRLQLRGTRHASTAIRSAKAAATM